MTAPAVRRTLYVCFVPPCGNAGGAVILRNLFADFPADRLGIVVDRFQLEVAQASSEDQLLWRSFAVRLPRRLTRRGVRVIGNTLRALCIPLTTLKVARAAKKFDADVIFAVQDGGQLFVAAWLAHLLVRRELFVYAMDDWQQAARMHGRLPAAIARFSMPRIVKAASKTWAISPAMQTEWQTHYGAHPELLWHSVDLSKYSERSDHGRTAPIRFVCVASIYGVNADAFKTVLGAFRALRSEGHDAEFLLYTAAPESLPTFGIAEEPGFTIGRVTADELPIALAEADIGVLALGFSAEWRRVVEVALPTKLAEYLAAELPVLVHAPSNCTSSQYIGDNDCGVVVAEPSEAAVLQAMRDLISDPMARRRLGKNGRRLAEQNHSRTEVTTRFINSFRSVG